MSTHNIYFHAETRKLICGYSLISRTTVDSHYLESKGLSEIL